MTMLVEAWNFIIFYLVLEGISLIFYTIATRTFSYGGVESGLKYYSLGALTSVLLLTGILWVWISQLVLTDFLVISLAVKALGLSASKLKLNLQLIKFHLMHLILKAFTAKEITKKSVEPVGYSPNNTS